MPDNESFTSRQQPSSCLPSRLTHYLADHGFTSERLTMRPISEADKALYRRLYCDEKIMRNICQPFTETEADKAFETSLKATLKALQHPDTPPSYMLWVIVEKVSGLTTGVIGLNWDKTQRDLAEIGIMMLPKAQGKLLADEAVIALIKHSKKTLQLSEIKACFSIKNLATKRIVKKLGFKQRSATHPAHGIGDEASESQLEYFLNLAEESQ
ncbi:GNAT family N-acetyltransferase [Shewanella insulae]|uniref:GNAT family N-acetyltransferase n=1 Tax=Shewanella insulae TaxID=2681496 RepID=UPI001EFDF63D|nr:GNAT family N-acetyltransferase [Shewanella insulae]MCG9714579.1 GNAT family N-acetyltransferase [Shewanella insulae]